MSPPRGPAVEVALETSSARPSVAARLAGRSVELYLSGERPHASDLLPALERLMAELDAAPGDIAAVLVGTGPGSYTGLRVGVATALGLARGTGAALRGVPSLEALAFGTLTPGQAATVLLDARQGELYVARYRREEAGIHELLAPTVAPATAVASLLGPDELVLADEAALRAAGLESERSRQPQRFAQAWPSAAALLELGAERLARKGPQSPAEVEPLYLRAFAVRAQRR